MVIWVCGLSASGKTSLCNALWQLLKPQLPQLVLLDGDSVRAAFGDGLGYREEDRFTQIKRIQSIAKMLSDQDLVVLVAALYAHPDLLSWNRENINHYFEVYLKASLDTVRSRDDAGLYARAEAGEIANVVGIDIKWHAPESPDLVFNSDKPEPPEDWARQVVAAIPHLSLALETK